MAGQLFAQKSLRDGDVGREGEQSRRAHIEFAPLAGGPVCVPIQSKIRGALKATTPVSAIGLWVQGAVAGPPLVVAVGASEEALVGFSAGA